VIYSTRPAAFELRSRQGAAAGAQLELDFNQLENS